MHTEPTYVTPPDVNAVCEVLDDDSTEATIVAGNQSLGLLIKEDIISPEALVDINDIDELRGIDVTDSTIRIGSTTKHRTIETDESIGSVLPALQEAAGRIADVQIRNAGTVGGVCAYADPTADYPPVFIALDGEIVTRSVDGETVYDADAFFTGYYESALGDNELITEVRLPVPDSTSGVAFEKLALRENDRALVNVAVRLDVSDGDCTDARIVVGGVGDRPYASSAGAEILRGSEVTDRSIADAGAATREDVPIIPGSSVSESYLEQMVVLLTENAIQTAYDRGNTQS